MTNEQDLDDFTAHAVNHRRAERITDKAAEAFLERCKQTVVDYGYGYRRGFLHAMAFAVAGLLAGVALARWVL